MYQKIANRTPVEIGSVYYCNIYINQKKDGRPPVKVKIYESKNPLANSQYDYYIRSNIALNTGAILRQMRRDPKLWSCLDPLGKGNIK